MSKKIYFNGNLYDGDTKLVSILDRGLNFGDGLFEVVRGIDGKCLLFTKHIERMRESAQFLKMDIPYTNEELLKAAKELAEVNQVSNGEYYFQLTRGEALCYHHFPEEITRNFFMVFNHLRAMPDECWSKSVAVCQYPDIRWGLCKLKSINLLPNVLGKEKAKAKSVYEAIFLRETVKGKIITEGPSSSYFGVKDGVIYTPKLDNILAGTTRSVIINLAEENGLTVKETPILFEDYTMMDEAFLTSTVSEVMPVVKVDDYNIGTGVPGIITMKLQKLYKNFMKDYME
jgi:D-alanine transaminase